MQPTQPMHLTMRPSRLSTATTSEPCVVCGEWADQRRYVLRTPTTFRFFRACCAFHAAEYQRRHRGTEVR